ncbi:MAG: bifunctional (p)ppGpp synthetase/guanosine-3',5'-bis(diphosphate) 3'-pyrophosphohydrolase [Dehalococcoidia bacterium]|nr:bifunctional (p)ppGpp synthetase/guanosine-3',5'-bis(diphosphate) 3'-pyrophosphohydrolase [Dehalococcoidia bacterium]
MVVSRETPADVQSLLVALASYLPDDRVDAVRAALDFATQAHEGQLRQSGDPYITHPIAVAQLVAELRMDAATVAAALLHDVIEDCGVGGEELTRRFGADVARLVDGATKISTMGPPTATGVRSSADSETLRKMFVAMAEDVRVVILKLADRLHNMRTLEFLPEPRQQAIARETIDIYAPLASRLGIWQFMWELEDLAFRYLEPQEYARVSEMVAGRRTERERFVRRVEHELRDALAAGGVAADVAGRVKHLYSIRNKMARYARDGKTLDQIHDLIAVRVLVDSVADCYNALGVVHQTWLPLPGAFDDYIASPKQSLYQSLHTTVMGPGAHPFEVQIRTHEMHELAEYGVAAHWQYKEEPRKRDHQYEERLAWLRHLIEWQQEASGTDDFLESVKTDVFRDQVFVYTPRGDVRVLPAGSTPIDFAYRVHTDLGHHCVGARVNARLVPLATRLRTGDIVEVLRGRADRGPSRDWLIPALGYLGSSHSRQKVRQWFRRAGRGDNIARGKELLERERRKLGVADVPAGLAAQLGYDSFDDMLAAVGYGDVSLQSLAQRLAEHAPPPPAAPVDDTPVRRERKASGGVHVLGESGLHVVLARCCGPLPGDGIIGFITRSRGVTVHRRDCVNVRRQVEAERLVECDWGPAGDLYTAAVLVHAWDRVGLLRDVSTLVAAENVNMVGVRTQEHDDRTTTVHLTLETQGRTQVARLMSRLEAIRGIISVSRAET